MRSIKDFNFPLFHSAAHWLRQQGHDVFNPAEKDMENHGKDFGSKTGSEEEVEKKFGFSLRAALGQDLAWICAHAEGIALLPGYKESKGAMAEYYTARALGLKVIHLVNMASSTPNTTADSWWSHE